VQKSALQADHVPQRHGQLAGPPDPGGRREVHRAEPAAAPGGVGLLPGPSALLLLRLRAGMHADWRDRAALQDAVPGHAAKLSVGPAAREHPLAAGVTVRAVPDPRDRQGLHGGPTERAALVRPRSGIRTHLNTTHLKWRCCMLWTSSLDGRLATDVPSSNACTFYLLPVLSSALYLRLVQV